RTSALRTDSTTRTGGVGASLRPTQSRLGRPQATPRRPPTDGSRTGAALAEANRYFVDLRPGSDQGLSARRRPEPPHARRRFNCSCARDGTAAAEGARSPPVASPAWARNGPRQSRDIPAAGAGGARRGTGRPPFGQRADG